MRDQKVTRRECGRIGIADISVDKGKVLEACQDKKFCASFRWGW